MPYRRILDKLYNCVTGQEEKQEKLFIVFAVAFEYWVFRELHVPFALFSNFACHIYLKVKKTKYDANGKTTLNYNHSLAIVSCKCHMHDFAESPDIWLCLVLH